MDRETEIRANRLKQLEMAVATRNIEIQVTWTRFSALAVIQTAGLAAFSASFEQVAAGPRAVLASAGLAVALFWLAILRRTHWWADYWNDRISVVERRVFPDGPDVLGPNTKSGGVPMSWFAQGVALAFCVVWLALLAWDVVRAI